MAFSDVNSEYGSIFSKVFKKVARVVTKPVKYLIKKPLKALAIVGTAGIAAKLLAKKKKAKAAAAAKALQMKKIADARLVAFKAMEAVYKKAAILPVKMTVYSKNNTVMSHGGPAEEQEIQKELFVYVNGLLKELKPLMLQGQPVKEYNDALWAAAKEAREGLAIIRKENQAAIVAFAQEMIAAEADIDPRKRGALTAIANELKSGKITVEVADKKGEAAMAQYDKWLTEQQERDSLAQELMDTEPELDPSKRGRLTQIANAVRGGQLTVQAATAQAEAFLGQYSAWMEAQQAPPMDQEEPIEGLGAYQWSLSQQYKAPMKTYANMPRSRNMRKLGIKDVYDMGNGKVFSGFSNIATRNNNGFLIR